MKRKIMTIFVAVIFMSSMTLASIAESVRQLTEEQQKIKAEITSDKQKLTEVQSNMSDTMKEIQELSASIAEYESEIDGLNDKLDGLEDEIEQAEEDIRISEENHQKQLDLFHTRLVAMAEAGDTTYLDVLLNSADFTDLISNYYLVNEMANLDVELLEKIESETKRIQEEKEKLEEKKQTVIEAKAEIEKKNTALKNAKVQKDSYAAKLSDEETALQSRLDELSSESSKISAQIRQLEEEERRANGGSSASYSAYTGGQLSWPTRTTKRVNSIYAPGGRTDISVSGTVHKGIDLYAPMGTPIYAAASGKVSYINYSGWGGGYGTYVVISHGNGLYTLYAHGSGVGNISVGSVVDEDTVIMYAGSTGWSYGAHLHFEVCQGSVSNKVNPAPYLGIENREGAV